MTRDPVCCMTTDNRSVHRSIEAGQTYLFCSRGCKAKFDSDPGRYLPQSVRQVQAASRP